MELSIGGQNGSEPPEWGLRHALVWRRRSRCQWRLHATRVCRPLRTPHERGSGLSGQDDAHRRGGLHRCGFRQDAKPTCRSCSRPSLSSPNLHPRPSCISYGEPLCVGPEDSIQRELSGCLPQSCPDKLSTPAFYTWLQRAYLRNFNVSIIRFGDWRMKLNRKTRPVRQWQEIQLLSQRRASPRRGACIQQVRRRLLNTWGACDE
jgi:hypothetical protein